MALIGSPIPKRLYRDVLVVDLTPRQIAAINLHCALSSETWSRKIYNFSSLRVALLVASTEKEDYSYKELLTALSDWCRTIGDENLKKYLSENVPIATIYCVVNGLTSYEDLKRHTFKDKIKRDLTTLGWDTIVV